MALKADSQPKSVDEVLRVRWRGGRLSTIKSSWVIKTSTEINFYGSTMVCKKFVFNFNQIFSLCHENWWKKAPGYKNS